MSFQRRQLLRMLSYTFGSSFILPREDFALAAQNPAPAESPAPPANAAAKHELEGTEMEKSGRNRRFILPSSRSGGVGALVPAILGDIAHTIELRLSRLAARGWTDRLQSFSRDK